MFRGSRGPGARGANHLLRLNFDGDNENPDQRGPPAKEHQNLMLSTVPEEPDLTGCGSPSHRMNYMDAMPSPTRNRNAEKFEQQAATSTSSSSSSKPKNIRSNSNSVKGGLLQKKPPGVVLGGMSRTTTASTGAATLFYSDQNADLVGPPGPETQSSEHETYSDDFESNTSTTMNTNQRGENNDTFSERVRLAAGSESGHMHRFGMENNFSRGNGAPGRYEDVSYPLRNSDRDSGGFGSYSNNYPQHDAAAGAVASSGEGVPSSSGNKILYPNAYMNTNTSSSSTTRNMHQMHQPQQQHGQQQLPPMLTTSTNYNSSPHRPAGGVIDAVRQRRLTGRFPVSAEEAEQENRAREGMDRLSPDISNPGARSYPNQQNYHDVDPGPPIPNRGPSFGPMTHLDEMFKLSSEEEMLLQPRQEEQENFKRQQASSTSSAEGAAQQLDDSQHGIEMSRFWINMADKLEREKQFFVQNEQFEPALQKHRELMGLKIAREEFSRRHGALSGHRSRLRNELLQMIEQERYQTCIRLKRNETELEHSLEELRLAETEWRKRVEGNFRLLAAIERNPAKMLPPMSLPGFLLSAGSGGRGGEGANNSSSDEQYYDENDSTSFSGVEHDYSYGGTTTAASPEDFGGRGSFPAAAQHLRKQPVGRSGGGGQHRPPTKGATTAASNYHKRATSNSASANRTTRSRNGGLSTTASVSQRMSYVSTALEEDSDSEEQEFYYNDNTVSSASQFVYTNMHTNSNRNAISTGGAPPLVTRPRPATAGPRGREDRRTETANSNSNVPPVAAPRQRPQSARAASQDSRPRSSSARVLDHASTTLSELFSTTTKNTASTYRVTRPGSAKAYPAYEQVRSSVGSKRKQSLERTRLAASALAAQQIKHFDRFQQKQARADRERSNSLRRQADWNASQYVERGPSPTTRVYMNGQIAEKQRILDKEQQAVAEISVMRSRQSLYNDSFYQQKHPGSTRTTPRGGVGSSSRPGSAPAHRIMIGSSSSSQLHSASKISLFSNRGMTSRSKGRVYVPRPKYDHVKSRLYQPTAAFLSMEAQNKGYQLVPKQEKRKTREQILLDKLPSKTHHDKSFSETNGLLKQWKGVNPVIDEILNKDSFYPRTNQSRSPSPRMLLEVGPPPLNGGKIANGGQQQGSANKFSTRPRRKRPVLGGGAQNNNYNAAMMTQKLPLPAQELPAPFAQRLPAAGADELDTAQPSPATTIVSVATPDFVAAPKPIFPQSVAEEQAVSVQQEDVKKAVIPLDQDKSSSSDDEETNAQQLELNPMASDTASLRLAIKKLKLWKKLSKATIGGTYTLKQDVEKPLFPFFLRTLRALHNLQNSSFNTRMLSEAELGSKSEQENFAEGVLATIALFQNWGSSVRKTLLPSSTQLVTGENLPEPRTRRALMALLCIADMESVVEMFFPHNEDTNGSSVPSGSRDLSEAKILNPSQQIKRACYELFYELDYDAAKSLLRVEESEKINSTVFWLGVDAVLQLNHVESSSSAVAYDREWMLLLVRAHCEKMEVGRIRELFQISSSREQAAALADQKQHSGPSIHSLSSASLEQVSSPVPIFAAEGKKVPSSVVSVVESEVIVVSGSAGGTNTGTESEEQLWGNIKLANKDKNIVAAPVKQPSPADSEQSFETRAKTFGEQKGVVGSVQREEDLHDHDGDFDKKSNYEEDAFETASNGEQNDKVEAFSEPPGTSSSKNSADHLKILRPEPSTLQNESEDPKRPGEEAEADEPVSEQNFPMFHSDTDRGTISSKNSSKETPLVNLLQPPGAAAPLSQQEDDDEPDIVATNFDADESLMRTEGGKAFSSSNAPSSVEEEPQAAAEYPGTAEEEAVETKPVVVQHQVAPVQQQPQKIKEVFSDAGSSNLPGFKSSSARSENDENDNDDVERGGSQTKTGSPGANFLNMLNTAGEQEETTQNTHQYTNKADDPEKDNFETLGSQFGRAHEESKRSSGRSGSYDEDDFHSDALPLPGGSSEQEEASEEKPASAGAAEEEAAAPRGEVEVRGSMQVPEDEQSASASKESVSSSLFGPSSSEAAGVERFDQNTTQGQQEGGTPAPEEQRETSPTRAESTSQNDPSSTTSLNEAFIPSLELSPQAALREIMNSSAIQSSLKINYLSEWKNRKSSVTEEETLRPRENSIYSEDTGPAPLVRPPTFASSSSNVNTGEGMMNTTATPSTSLPIGGLGPYQSAAPANTVYPQMMMMNNNSADNNFSAKAAAPQQPTVRPLIPPAADAAQKPGSPFSNIRSLVPPPAVPKLPNELPSMLSDDEEAGVYEDDFGSDEDHDGGQFSEEEHFKEPPLQSSDSTLGLNSYGSSDVGSGTVFGSKRTVLLNEEEEHDPFAGPVGGKSVMFPTGGGGSTAGGRGSSSSSRGTTGAPGRGKNFANAGGAALPASRSLLQNIEDTESDGSSSAGIDIDTSLESIENIIKEARKKRAGGGGGGEKEDEEGVTLQ